MKLLIATTAAALIGTIATADQSTRYNDLRLDTTVGSETTFSRGTVETDLDAAQRGREQFRTGERTTLDGDVTFSTRGTIRSEGEGYLYGGYGPGNDSR
jgi:hypothetical protein